MTRPSGCASPRRWPGARSGSPPRRIPARTRSRSAAHDRARRALPMLALILAPRHPVRGDALADMLRGRGFQVAQRSKGEADRDRHRRLSRRHAGRDGSLVPGRRRSASSAARSPTSAGTIRSSLRCSAAPSCTGRMCATSATATGGCRARMPRCWCARRRSWRTRWSRRWRRTGPPRWRRAAWAACSEGAEVTDTVLDGDRRSARRQALMRAPRFWANPPGRPGIAARLLAPLAGSGPGRRAGGGSGRCRPRLGVPVICVGNLTAGGAGKTPTVIALVERLRARGIAVHVVSRGHGGSLAGPVRVDERRHSAAEVGDEPLLLAAFAPVWIGRDRAAAGAGGGGRGGAGGGDGRRFAEPGSARRTCRSSWSMPASASATAG